MTTPDSINPEVKKLGIRDIRKAMMEFDPLSETSKQDIRFLVRYYYNVQDDRKRSASQLREALGRRENNLMLLYLTEQHKAIEKAIKDSMDVYTDEHPIGNWLKQIYGIGPIIAAGIISSIDITRCPTSGHIQSFAGYNPMMKWEKGQKRPYNVFLKTIFYHAGMSFVKFSGNDKCVYGKWFLAKLQEYRQLNDSGAYAEQAKNDLRKYAKETQAYKQCLEGKLPAAQIVARARRWTIKLLISHLHEFWYNYHYGRPPAQPYAISILGHAHYIPFGEYPANYKDLKPSTQDLADNEIPETE